MSLMFGESNWIYFEFTFFSIEVNFWFSFEGDSETFSDHYWGEFPVGLIPVIQFLKGPRLMAERHLSPGTPELFFCTSHSLNQSTHQCLTFCINKGSGYLQLIDKCANGFHWLMKSYHLFCSFPLQIDQETHCFIIIKHNLGFEQ